MAEDQMHNHSSLESRLQAAIGVQPSGCIGVQPLGCHLKPAPNRAQLFGHAQKNWRGCSDARMLALNPWE
jgi:hypothetical protein